MGFPLFKVSTPLFPRKRRGQATLPAAGNPEGYLEALAVLCTDFADALDAPPGSSTPPFPHPGIEEGLRGVALRPSLSDGQQQCVAIARAMTREPKLIALDEPTAAQAVREVGQVLNLVSGPGNGASASS